MDQLTALREAPQETTPGRRSARGAAGRAAAVRLLQALPVIGFAGLWQVVVELGLVPRDVVPGPLAVFARTVVLIAAGGTWSAIGQTLIAWFIGLCLAFAIGSIVGAVAGSSKNAYRLLRLTIDFLRAVPAVALLPLALVIFGPYLKMQVFLIAFASVWVVLVQMVYAIWDVDPAALDVARSYRLSWPRRLRWVILPSVGSHLATALRLASVVGLLTCIGAELLGGAPGLGYLLFQTQNGGRPEDAYAYGLIASLLALVIDGVFVLVERRALAWHPKYRVVAP